MSSQSDTILFEKAILADFIHELSWLKTNAIIKPKDFNTSSELSCFGLIFHIIVTDSTFYRFTFVLVFFWLSLDAFSAAVFDIFANVNIFNTALFIIWTHVSAAAWIFLIPIFYLIASMLSTSYAFIVFIHIFIILFPHFHRFHRSFYLFTSLLRVITLKF